jgi:hypothetical protein
MIDNEYPCPCGGTTIMQKKNVELRGIDMGVLDIVYCKKCGSEYYPEESMRIIEQKLKAAGLWGTEKSKVTFWKSGNTVVLRIPVKLANALNIKANMKASLYQEGKDKLVIERFSA